MKIHCNVIRDLMPSYIDNICSEDTRKLVDEHIRECDRCRETLRCMGAPDPDVGEKDRIQIDYMRKIRNHFNLICLGCYLLLFLMMALIIYIICRRHYLFSDDVFMVILPIMIMAAFITAGDDRKRTKKKTAMCAVAVILVLGEIFVMGMTFVWGTGEQRPLWLEVQNLGPFIRNFLLFFMTGELLLLGYCVIDGRLKNINNSFCGAISATGAVMAAAFITILTKLTDFNMYITVVFRLLVSLTAELLVMLICYGVYLHYRKRG